MGGSRHGNAHSSVDISAELEVGLFPFFSKQGGQLLQQGFSFFAEETIR